MRTVLVISPGPEQAAAIRHMLDPVRYRIVEKAGVEEEDLRRSGHAVDLCVLDADLNGIAPIRALETLRRVLPRCPVIFCCGESRRDWEEEAHLLGVSHILKKPVHPRLMSALAGRLLDEPLAAPRRVEPDFSPPAPRRPDWAGGGDTARLPARTLETLRDYSAVLSHTLCADAMMREFLLLLREILGVNRSAVFLGGPGPAKASGGLGATAPALKPACTVGLSHETLEHLALSLGSGIGGHLFQTGRLLRRDSDAAMRDPHTRREFELLGAEVAIPILDRENLVGVLVLDGRVTGEPIGNEELTLIFHLLEPLGQAVRNIWLHDKLASRHGMMDDILRQIKNGCVVVGADMQIWHANDMARASFGRAGRSAAALEFSDLPQPVGAKVFEVLKTGRVISDFHYRPAGAAGAHFLINVSPFRSGESGPPAAALLVVEDCADADRLQALEIETANLRLVRHMADRLAHEIGNAIVPISTHQQLFKERIADGDFQSSLAEAMEEGIKRVGRLVGQMRFLARDEAGQMESVPVRQLIEEAFREARSYHPASTVLLQFEASGEPLAVSCDRKGMQHAFAEIILNALQANTQSCQVHVRTRAETDPAGARWARIEVQDSGSGFSAEAAGKASEPFYTTRNVGLGLGLAVTNQIIRTHCGKMEIPTPRNGSPGLVCVRLPLNPQSAPSA